MVWVQIYTEKNDIQKTIKNQKIQPFKVFGFFKNQKPKP